MGGKTQPLPEVLKELDVRRERREDEKFELEHYRVQLEAAKAQLEHYKMELDTSKTRRAEFIALRNLLFDRERELLKGYEQTLVALSGGVLGLSITFIQQIAPHPHDTSWLLGAWIGFGLALLVLLVAFLLSARAIRLRWDSVDRREQGLPQPMGWDWVGWIAGALNVVGLVAFIAGVGFLIVFVYLNLPK